MRVDQRELKAMVKGERVRFWVVSMGGGMEEEGDWTKGSSMSSPKLALKIIDTGLIVLRKLALLACISDFLDFILSYLCVSNSNSSVTCNN